MKDEVEVSVVVAVHDVEHYLPDCLNSLRDQKDVRAEFVCVDDGSTDSSGRILDDYAKGDSRFRIVHLAENRGTLLARKAGVEAACGQFLMFVDGDDELAPGAVERALAGIRRESVDIVNFGTSFLRSSSDADVAACERYFKIQSGRIVSDRPYDILKACVTENRFKWILWNKIYRTELVKNAVAQLADVKVIQGDDLYIGFLILAQTRSIVLVGDPFYRYRVGCGVSTGKGLDESQFRRYCDYVEIHRQLGLWSSRQPADPMREECLSAAVDTSARMYDNIFANRLLPGLRRDCLRHLYGLCEKANLLRLVQGCKGVSVNELEELFEPAPEDRLPEPVFDRTDAVVCLTPDDNYAPFAGVVLASLIAHSRPDRNYDIVLLTRDMSLRRKRILCSLSQPNVSIRVIDIRRHLSGGTFHISAHFQQSVYYRLLAPEIFAAYDKIVYLDCDIVVNRDIADLYAEDVSGWMLAAVPDTQVMAMRAGYPSDGELVTYLRDTLRLDDATPYFQAGVAVYNLKGMRQSFPSGHLINRAYEQKYRWLDQDILNVECKGRIRELPLNWNTTIAVHPDDALEFHLPTAILANYLAARRDPWIVHYIAQRIPAFEPKADLAEYFWKYARQSPFYEVLIGLQGGLVAERRMEKFHTWVRQVLGVHYEQIESVYNALPMRLWRGVRKMIGVLRHKG